MGWCQRSWRPRTRFKKRTLEFQLHEINRDAVHLHLPVNPSCQPPVAYKWPLAADLVVLTM